jgi:hypothetical protein
MISNKNLNYAIRAVGSLISLARYYSETGKSSEETAKLLDRISYLPNLMLENENRDIEFQQALHGISELFTEAKMIYFQYIQHPE